MYLLCMFTLPIIAQDPGDLHMAFGQDGIFSVSWENTSSTTDDIGMLSDGSLIVAGNYIEDASSDLKVMVIKISDQGDPVPFGNGAHGFEYDISLLNSIQALCVLPGDRILIAVGANWTIESPHLVMLNADDNHPVLLMIDQTGEPVSSFGNSGMYTLSSIKGTFSDLVIDREARQMYVSGGSFSSPDCDAFLVKYELPEGYRNSDFGLDGILCLSEDSGFNGSVNSIVYEGNSHTLTAFGYLLQEGDRDIFAYRVSADDGAADNTFGINGLSVLMVPGTDENLESALVQPDGKYLFGGNTNYSGNRDFMIGRINSAGMLDLSFGNNGLKISEIYSGRNNSLDAIVLSPDCDILYAAGRTDTPDNTAIAVAAYYTGYEPETGLGIYKNVSGLVNISPNPVKDHTRIHTGQPGLHRVRIFDLAGKTVFHQNCLGDDTELNLSFLSPGVYSIQITLLEKQVGICRLLKQ